MQNMLSKKLSRFVDLSKAERAALDRFSRRTASFKRYDHLIREGERPDKMHLLVDGWACRYKLLSNGKRQIFSYLVPGDLCDLNLFVLGIGDYSTMTLDSATVAFMSEQELEELFAEYPNIELGMLRNAMVDEAILRQWLISAGQRDAYESIAHLFYELWLRLRGVGLVSNGAFTLPLTQQELGDTVGLTPVHVNRVLQRLRDEKIISLSQRELDILDAPRLAIVADFEAEYLNLWLEPALSVGADISAAEKSTPAG